MTKTCLRPDCNKPLGSGTKYCSTKCAARDRKRVKEAKNQIVLSHPNYIPDGLAERLRQNMGDQADFVLGEVAAYLEEKPISIPMPLEKTTYADITLSFEGTKDMRPGTRLRYDIVDMMLRSGPVIFAMEMKRLWCNRSFSPGHFTVESPDEELAEIAQASLEFILPKMAEDFSYSAFAYGSSFQEEVWEWKSRYELGLSKSKGAVTRFLVPKVPASVKPETVAHILREKDTERFNGFAQRRRGTTTADTTAGLEPIKVSRERALVIPLNEHFGNLWGESFLKPLYPTWLWYEVILRTMHRYMERMAMPVVVGRAPARGTVTVEGKDTPVRSMDLILAIAGNIAKSNAAAVPSDRDEHGDYLWDIEYLTAEARSQSFIDVLEYLQQEMLRAALSADRSLTQSSGGVGSYKLGEVHAAASAISTEALRMQLVFYLNKYFMPGFSLYNRGRNGPPIWLKVQAIDVQEREMLMKILATSGNTEAGEEFYRMVNWRVMAETSNIPTLSEEEAAAKEEERLDKSLKRQEKQQKMMQKFQVDGKLQPKQNEPDKKVDQAAKDVQEGNTVKQEQLIIEAIFRGEKIPLILGAQDAQRLGFSAQL